MKRNKVLDADFKDKIDKVLRDLKISLYDLHEAATRDPKTGLYNHQFFTNLFEMELEKTKRGNQQLSMIAIDIDFFKRINDTHGHLVGDEILFELGSVLNRMLRKYDVLSRFGGEEFFVLLPQTSLSRALKVAQRLRKSLSTNPVLKKYEVTISLGVTQYKDRDSLTRMMKRCDKALYAAKKAGRNTVCKN